MIKIIGLIKRCVLLVVMLELVVCILPGVVYSSVDQLGKNILLLHSYHIGYKWSDDITASVRNILQGNNNVDLFVEHLDIKRQSSPEKLNAFRMLLAEKYNSTSFAAILCVDNSSLSFMLNNRHILFPEVPLVFCGINSFTSRLLQGQKNITGVREEIDIRKTVEMMLSLHPKTKRIVVINDETETGNTIKNESLLVSNSFTDIKWYLPPILSIEELDGEINALEKGDLILLGSFSRDFNGQHIEYDKVARLVTGNRAIPSYGLWDFYLGKGIVGGYLASGSLQGEKAAEILLEIINGAGADDIPISMDRTSQYFADYKVLLHFNIDVDNLPLSTIIINRPPEFYASHKVEIWFVLAAFAVLSILSIFLSLTVMKKRKAELALREFATELSERVDERTKQLSATVEELNDSQEQMQHLLSNLTGMVYRCKNDKNWSMIYLSLAVKSITGYNPDELVDNSNLAFSDLIDVRDRQMVEDTVEDAIRNKTHFTLEYRIQTKTGVTKWVWEQGLAVYDRKGDVLYIDGIISDISDKKFIEQEQRRLATVVHQTDELVILTDLAGNIEYVNPAFERVTGYTMMEVIGESPKVLKSGKHDISFYEQMWAALIDGNTWRGRIINKRKDTSEYIAEATILPIRDNSGEVINYVGLQRDITHEIFMETNLRQAQKLEAMGTLAGGIAHEINTPAQYVGTNLDFILESFSDLQEFIHESTSLKEKGVDIQRNTEKIGELYEQNDIEYLLEEIPTALRQSIEGITQISNIVHSMKQFAHPGEESKVQADINELVTNTANVCRNEWKYVADIEYNLDQQLPLVSCHQSELNQVILNIIVNAAHAIGAKSNPEDAKGCICISTGRIENGIEIAIKDNGGGIPKDMRERIFDPFFTTKEPGKGTGQGLAIAHSIITEKHQGKLFVESISGQGSTFFIHLPLIEDK